MLHWLQSKSTMTAAIFNRHTFYWNQISYLLYIKCCKKLSPNINEYLYLYLSLISKALFCQISSAPWFIMIYHIKPIFKIKYRFFLINNLIKFRPLASENPLGLFFRGAKGIWQWFKATNGYGNVDGKRTF